MAKDRSIGRFQEEMRTERVAENRISSQCYIFGVKMFDETRPLLHSPHSKDYSNKDIKLHLERRLEKLLIRGEILESSVKIETKIETTVRVNAQRYPRCTRTCSLCR